MNFAELRANSNSIIEGFFSNLFITDSHCYKILKKKRSNEREILDYEFQIGKYFSPEIYEAIVLIDSDLRHRYGLKMKKVIGITLQDWIKINRKELNSKDYLRRISNICDKILERIEKAYGKMNYIPVSKLINVEFLENYYKSLQNILLEIGQYYDINLNNVKLGDAFSNSLTYFIKNFDFEMVPQLHGDLNPSNIFISEGETNEIFIIDPYNPYLQRSSNEILNIPLDFSCFFDICCLKVTLEGFAYEKNEIDLYKKAFRIISILNTFKENPKIMHVWEILVNLRNASIFYFNSQYVNNGNMKIKHLYGFLAKKYIQNLKKFTIDEL